MCMVCALIILCCLVVEPDRRVSIRLRHTEMALGFNGDYAGQRHAASSPRIVPTLTRDDTALPDKRCEQHEHVFATACAALRAGCEEAANSDDRDHPVERDGDGDSD